MAFMYCKLFASLYQGTLRGKAHEILVFTNMLAHADAEGYVDKHFRAIADEVGLSVEEVKVAIAALEAPDEESRSPEKDGRRIVRVNDSRAWGWHVVNYGKYRAIKNDEDRRESNRKAQEKWREKQRLLKLGVSASKQDVSASNQESSQSAQGEEEGYGEGKEEESIRRVNSWNPTHEQIEVASWFGMRPTTKWDAKWQKKWKEIVADFDFSSEDYDALKWYYTESGCKFLRKDLGTLLNNWQGEITRAKNYEPEKR